MPTAMTVIMTMSMSYLSVPSAITWSSNWRRSRFWHYCEIPHFFTLTLIDALEAECVGL